MFFEFLGKVDSMFVVPCLTTYIDGSFQIKVQISIRLQLHKEPRVKTFKRLKVTVYLDELVQSRDILQFGVAVQQECSMISIGQSFCMELLKIVG